MAFMNNSMFEHNSDESSFIHSSINSIFNHNDNKHD